MADLSNNQNNNNGAGDVLSGLAALIREKSNPTKEPPSPFQDSFRYDDYQPAYDNEGQLQFRRVANSNDNNDGQNQNQGNGEPSKIEALENELAELKTLLMRRESPPQQNYQQQQQRQPTPEEVQAYNESFMDTFQKNPQGALSQVISTQVNQALMPVLQALQVLAVHQDFNSSRANPEFSTLVGKYGSIAKNLETAKVPYAKIFEILQDIDKSSGGNGKTQKGQKSNLVDFDEFQNKADGMRREQGTNRQVQFNTGGPITRRQAAQLAVQEMYDQE